MTWDIRGTDLPVEFRVDRDELSISGKARQTFRQDLFPSSPAWCDMTKANSLPADWSIYRARQAGADTVSMAGLDLREPMKQYLDLDTVRITTIPVGAAKYFESPFGMIAFWIFLPDPLFEDVLDLAKLSAVTARFIGYRIGFDLRGGFIPHRVEGQPDDIISYDEWLAGRPCLFDQHDFYFRLIRRNVDPELNAIATTPRGD